MDLARALTNDLERMIRFYRVPVLTAMGMSLRVYTEDRFLLTDPRTTDVRRGIVNLERISQIRRLSTKLGMGLDDRYMLDMGGNFLFAGLPNADETQIVPLENTTIVGGRLDALDVAHSYTGGADDKLAKIRRYSARKPQEINWRVRLPLMMANQTTVIDYLAFRCSKLPFLHSIAIKWGDRRWDPRRVAIGEDLYRPDGEDSDMIILSPVWMDETMTRLDPNIWGAYESIVAFNYEEFLARQNAEYEVDLTTFLDNYGVWASVVNTYSQCALLDPDQTNTALAGQIQRRLSVTANRVLHIPFDARLRSGEYSFRSVAYDQQDSRDVTDDIFNAKNADNTITYSSGFLSPTLEEDGWYKTGTASRISASTDPETEDVFKALPPVTNDLNGNPVKATHFMRLSTGQVARRMVLPDGQFLYEVLVNVPDHGDSVVYNLEIIRNTRFRTKKAIIGAASRVTDIRHYRESYETVARARIASTGGSWQNITLSFRLKDHYFVSDEAYPAHEVYIVFSLVNERPIDIPTPPPIEPMGIGPMRLHQNIFGHTLNLINTASRYRFSNLLRDEEKMVSLEHAFQDDQVFQGIERATGQCRLDGNNTCVLAEHRSSYNLRKEGTSINTWVKVNSADEAQYDVLARRGGFNLFLKGGNLFQYQSTVDADRRVSMLFFTLDAEGNSVPVSLSSRSYHNNLLNPCLGYDGFDFVRTIWPNAVNLPYQFWPDQRVYRNYRTAYQRTGFQPREWFDDSKDDGNTIIASHGSVMVVPIEQVTAIGGNKRIRVQNNDPYLAWGGFVESDDAAYQYGGMWRNMEGNVITINPGTHVTLWRYFEWHARRSYGVDTDDIEQNTTFGDYAKNMSTGFVFAPVASNYYLLEVPANYGQYRVSPEEWDPRYSPFASPAAQGDGIIWPVSPRAWGMEWPRDGANNPYGDIENPFSPWSWKVSGQDLDPLFETWPVFLAGRVEFDRWWNFSFHASQDLVEIYMNGLRVIEITPADPMIPFTFNDHFEDQKNTNDLWIGTTDPDTISTCSPISLYSFKIFQRTLTPVESLRIYGDEGINFNDYQYNLFAPYMDIDLDGVLDPWQDDFSEIGFGVSSLQFPWQTSPTVKDLPQPRDLTQRFGTSVVLAGDSIVIPSIQDRNFNLLDDHYDDKYVDELVEIQRNGFSDGLIFWDFYHEDQEAVHSLPSSKWVKCVGYENDRLVYKDWLLDKIGTEFNAIKALSDAIPYLNDLSPQEEPAYSPYGSPATSPGASPQGPRVKWPTYGDSDNELVLAGVKGWFGFQDLMGYRDSLERLRKEGLIFNYLQVEFRFRADRATLEAHLKDYAQDYEDIYFDRYEGNLLTSGEALIDPVS